MTEPLYAWEKRAASSIRPQELVLLYKLKHRTLKDQAKILGKSTNWVKSYRKKHKISYTPVGKRRAIVSLTRLAADEKSLSAFIPDPSELEDPVCPYPESNRIV